MMKLENASMKTWRLAMAGVALALVSPLTLAAAAIQAITSTQQAGTEVVRIDLSEPLATLPAGLDARLQGSVDRVDLGGRARNGYVLSPRMAAGVGDERRVPRTARNGRGWRTARRRGCSA